MRVLMQKLTPRQHPPVAEVVLVLSVVRLADPSTQTLAVEVRVVQTWYQLMVHRNSAWVQLVQTLSMPMLSVLEQMHRERLVKMLA
ncbi:hypothetical protein D3C71_1621880 [compost metagenome]